VGGKTRTGADGEAAQGWDHDPPAQRKWTPLGILIMATGVLTSIFGTHETSDFWVDGLKMWWQQVKGGLGFDPAVGDLSGQRPEQLGKPYAVLEAND
jgi:DDE family transposase